MRVLFWYCDTFGWRPALKTLADAPDAAADTRDNAVVAFIQVEPQDAANEGSIETKLVKHAKWLARKWEASVIVLHSFTHLGEAKADPETAKGFIDRAQRRLESAGYQAVQTPYGYFNDLTIQAQGHPLARIYKEL